MSANTFTLEAAAAANIQVVGSDPLSMKLSSGLSNLYLESAS